MTADSTSSSHAIRLTAIILILAAGILTGAQLGKVAPLIPWYQEHIGLSLVSAGWLAAILGIFVALAAIPVGFAIDRTGLVRAISAGAATLVIGGIILAFSTAPAIIFGARLIEASGYVILCIALPAVLNEISPVHWKGPVLAIWSGFVPLGFALTDFMTAAMLPALSEATLLLLISLLFAVAITATLGLLKFIPLSKPAAEQGALKPNLTKEVLLITAGFGAFVVISVAMFTFMPTFVGSKGTYYLVTAGTVALTVPIGNILTGILVRGRDARFMSWLAVIGFAISTVAAVPAFTSENPALATSSAIAMAISGAIVASALFAAIPFLTPAKGSVPIAIGIVSQAGGLATVLSPPLAAAIIDGFGWVGLGWFLAIVSALGVLAVFPLTSVDAQKLH